MSDCSKQAWHVPEQREPGTFYIQGHPNVDYSAAAALVVDGMRFERLRTCYRVLDKSRANVFGIKHRCSECNELLPEVNFCDNCGAKVVSADD